MTKGKKDSFVIELKLLIDTWQKDILLKRFEIARTLYNTTLSYAVKQHTLMQESKHYRKQLRCYQKAKKSNDSKELKQTAKELDKYLYWRNKKGVYYASWIEVVEVPILTISKRMVL
ncbi:hypothetical protein [Lysinibacillus sp. NPDC059133]|uniref:hypothetical protein n=1 Tax=Lysinibacillus sp. NPDC059133 TaxID=3346737 RepID=UPI00368ABE5A